VAAAELNLRPVFSVYKSLDICIGFKEYLKVAKIATFTVASVYIHHIIKKKLQEAYNHSSKMICTERRQMY
jgi:hypothetical protein